MAMGDDSDASVLFNLKTYSIGSTPIMLTAKGAEIFVGCDSPAFVYVAGGRLHLTTVNEDNYYLCAQTSLKHGSHEIVLFYDQSEGALVFGSILSVQKLQIKHFGMKREVNRVCVLPDESGIGALFEVPDYGYLDESKRQLNTVSIMNPKTCEPLCSSPLDSKELGLDIASFWLQHTDDQTLLVAVGTAYIDPEEKNVSRGRILLYEAQPSLGNLYLRSIEPIKASVQVLRATSIAGNSYLLAGQHNTFVIYKVRHSG